MVMMRCHSIFLFSVKKFPPPFIVDYIHKNIINAPPKKKEKKLFIWISRHCQVQGNGSNISPHTCLPFLKKRISSNGDVLTNASFTNVRKKPTKFSRCGKETRQEVNILIVFITAERRRRKISHETNKKKSWGPLDNNNFW
jgi:hypothetical protein